MADKDKSRGVENVDLSKIDGMGNGQKPKGCGNKSCYCVRIADDDSKPSDMAIRITADVGEAITGFKALQRELREATKAARELEQAYKDADKAVNSGVINVMDKDRGLLASIGRDDIITNNDIIVEIDGKEVGKAIYPTTFDLQASALKRAVEESEQIPDRLREDILAKFAEDEAKIAELERKLND